MMNTLKNMQKYRKTPKGVLTNIYSKMKERCKKYKREMPDFTLNELHERFLNDSKYIGIYNNWALNGYKCYDKPSVDRINPDKSYSMDNIQIMTWGENRLKGDFENAKRFTTSVLMFNKNGKFETMFESVKDAVNYTGLSQGNIIACCQGKRNHTGGFIFKYRGDKFRKHKNQSLLEVQ